MKAAFSGSLPSAGGRDRRGRVLMADLGAGASLCVLTAGPHDEDGALGPDDHGLGVVRLVQQGSGDGRASQQAFLDDEAR